MKLASALILAAVSSASAFVIGPTSCVTPTTALQAQAAKSHEEDVELTRQAIISFRNGGGGVDDVDSSAPSTKEEKHQQGNDGSDPSAVVTAKDEAVDSSAPSTQKEEEQHGNDGSDSSVVVAAKDAVDSSAPSTKKEEEGKPKNRRKKGLGKKGAKKGGKKSEQTA
jgi:hypothetical protein